MKLAAREGNALYTCIHNSISRLSNMQFRHLVTPLMHDKQVIRVFLFFCLLCFSQLFFNALYVGNVHKYHVLDLVGEENIMFVFCNFFT